MTALRAYLVDDEPLALARLSRLLAETGRVDVVGTTTEPEEAVARLTAARPDVCFLDIHLPRLSGFDVLARLPAQPWLGERLWFVDLADVTHFYAEDKLTYAATLQRAYCVDETLTELEQRLDPAVFVRIHRATLVNARWIADMSALPGGGLQVRLRDARQTGLTVSRDRAREFRRRMTGES